ncbi:MAG: thiamine pyrophosphate-dependent dehydrogenase E1 component subunit alpha [Acidobacteriales bacterium]|nr:thiamine pyrophosphate-dependent dehydrogenase E1 component subunit alpha [Terriglobales bacterium]
MATKAKERTETTASLPIPVEKMKQLYAMMLRCRTMEERARILYKQSRFSGNYYAAIGQEAIEVGAAIDLRPSDCVAPSHRDFIAGLIKGVPLKSLFSQLYARKTSPDQGRSSPAHGGYAPLNIITPASTIAAQWNIGTGVALALKMQKKDDITMAFCGEGATSLGFWHEAVNFAAVLQLPIVYVVQNNRWAESVNIKYQMRNEDVATRAAGYGIPGISVDGQDVVAVYRVVQEAIERARKGGGPTLVECKSYRWFGHSEIDPAKYRDAEEVEFWHTQRDPIPLTEEYMRKHGVWSDEEKQQVLDAFNKDLEEAIQFAENAPWPEPVEALDHVYSFSIRERALELDRKTWTPQALKKM